MSGPRGDRWLRRALKGDRLSVVLRVAPAPIRVHALREVRRVERRDALPHAASLLHHPAPGVRRAAARVLGELGGPEHTEALLTRALSEPGGGRPCGQSRGRRFSAGDEPPRTGARDTFPSDPGIFPGESWEARGIRRGFRLKSTNTRKQF